jgi:phi13 family phage major tail protein
MAKVGLKHLVYAIANDNGTTITYSGGRVLARAMTANINITTSDVELSSDDAVSESDSSFSSGTISSGIDDYPSYAKVDLLGYAEGSEVDVSTGEKELSTAGADSPYVGYGFYGRGVKTSANYWRAIWLVKVKFKESNEEFNTKGRTVEFKTPTIEGAIHTASYDSTYWKEEARFSTEDGAITWLNAKAGIGSGASNDISVLTMSNGTLTPTFAATTYNYSCALTDTPTVINATFAAGTAKVYVDGVYDQSLTTTVNATGIAVADGASKLITIVVKEAGKTEKTYNIMTQNAS